LATANHSDGSQEALAIAEAAQSDARPTTDAFDPRGLKTGDKVTVSADDYGRSPRNRVRHCA
jgi:glutathione S-transferase